jgi:hypothetical protein
MSRRKLLGALAAVTVTAGLAIPAKSVSAASAPLTTTAQAASAYTPPTFIAPDTSLPAVAGVQCVLFPTGGVVPAYFVCYGAGFSVAAGPDLFVAYAFGHGFLYSNGSFGTW